MRWLAGSFWLVALCACNALFGIDDFHQGEIAASQGSGNGGEGAGGATASNTGGSGASTGASGGMGGAGADVKTLVFQANAALGGATNTFTFSGMPIGHAAFDRRIIVGVIANQNGATLAQLTVAGIDAQLVDQVIGSQEHLAALAVAHVPDGIVADIEAIFTGNQHRAAIGVWSATGLQTNAPHDFASTVQPMAVTLATRPDGFAVAIAGHVDNGRANWLNATERFDSLVLGHESVYTGADASTAGGSLEIEVHGLDNLRRGLVAAAW